VEDTTLVKRIAIVGATGSGKTNLAVNLAEQFHGEIVCADSRTLYKGMDIGTAKPDPDQRARVRHHLLDVIDPNQRLSAAEFKHLAEDAIVEIESRGKVPFLVGGSGLYVDAVLYDYKFPAQADAGERAKLDQMSLEELVNRLESEDPGVVEVVDLKNRRRLIRAIETAGQPRSRRKRVAPGWLTLGMTLNKNVAQMTITSRVKKMLEIGFLDEVEKIGTEYGWESQAMNIIGYRAMKDVVLGHKTVEEGAADFVRSDMGLFKKQVTWFKRNPDIVWVENPQQATEKVKEFLGGAV
jgi:tRNA dimethylallyltransferase